MNDRLVAAKLLRVFRLQRPKRGLSPAFTALRRNLNRIATGYDGSGHGRTAVRIGMCDRDGSQMLVVRRSCAVRAIRLAGALRGSGNTSGSRRRICSHHARHRLVWYHLTGNRPSRRARPR